MIDNYFNNYRVLLSIIIPVYNSENNISILLDSIINTNSQELEIIIVDDGSLDNTLKKCNEYSIQDNRIKVFRKDNGGVSSARNYGLEQARGEYIYFCDSDDYVFENILDEGLSHIKREGADLFLFDYEYLFLSSGNRSYSSFILSPQKTLDRDYIINNIIKPLVRKESTDMASLWNKFFKRSIIVDNCLRFDEGVHKGEDWRFILDFLTVAETAYYIPKVLYEYRLDGTQSESKYRVAIGLSALGSVKRKLDLNQKFNLGADKNQMLNWYYQLLEQVVITIQHNCSKAEWYEMLRDPDVIKAAEEIRITDDEKLIELEISRKYKLYSKLIHLKLYCAFLAICRRLEK